MKTNYNGKDKALIKSFLLKYDDAYNNYAQFIMNNFYNEIGEKSDTICSIKSYLNLNEIKNDKYKSYFNFLKKNYDLTGNIMEVACGPFPTISTYVDNYQRHNKKGSICAYDPVLINGPLGKIQLNREYFDDNTDISNIDFIFATSPCKLTMDLIRIANNNDKEFSILLCSCLSRKFRNRNAYLNYLIKYAYETNNEDANINIEYLDDEYNYPIIYKKKY